MANYVKNLNKYVNTKFITINLFIQYEYYLLFLQTSKDNTKNNFFYFLAQIIN